MVEDAKSATLTLKMKVRELANSNDELAKILEDFQEEAPKVAIEGNLTADLFIKFQAVIISVDGS